VLQLVEDTGSYCFWADRDEATVREFEQWRTADAGAWDPTHCGWKTGISDPVAAYEDAGAASCGLWPDETAAPLDPAKPVRCVDWCDAEFFCAAVGERLCGATAGPPGGVNETPNEYQFLCGGKNSNLEPYGSTPRPGVCNTGQVEEAGCVTGFSGSYTVGCGPWAAEVYPDCVSPTGVSDAVGSVAEWVNVCVTTGDAAPQATQCFRLGGSFATPTDLAQCTGFAGEPANRSAIDPFTGIRCCADLTPEESAMVAAGADR
jgi:formylglycine-generating enzyme required for sulfatase activity